jgi:hypothetical protein
MHRIMKTWTTSIHCLSGVHCHACKTDTAFRAQLATEWDVPAVCPFGGHPSGVQAPVRTNIPPPFRNLDFDALAARIEALGDSVGHELVAAQRDRVGKDGCTPCGRNAATATLRSWLARKEQVK